MDTQSFTTLLLGKDLRTIKQNSILVETVKDQPTFDHVFSLVLHHERPLVVRAGKDPKIEEYKKTKIKKRNLLCRAMKLANQLISIIYKCETF